MSKQIYIVNCYTCQHNGQETCKGCNTLLVGEDEPYENWQLREDLETKDQKIADLEAKLAQAKMNESFEKEKKDNAFKLIEELKQQLAEKEKEIESLITDLQKALALIKEGREIVDLNDKALERTDQDKISFAVEQLEKVKNRIESKVKNIEKRLDDLNIKIVCESTSRELSTYEETVKIINNQIKQLKEKK